MIDETGSVEVVDYSSEFEVRRRFWQEIIEETNKEYPSREHPLLSAVTISCGELKAGNFENWLESLVEVSRRAKRFKFPFEVITVINERGGEENYSKENRIVFNILSLLGRAYYKGTVPKDWESKLGRDLKDVGIGLDRINKLKEIIEQGLEVGMPVVPVDIFSLETREKIWRRVVEFGFGWSRNIEHVKSEYPNRGMAFDAGVYIALSRGSEWIDCISMDTVFAPGVYIREWKKIIEKGRDGYYFIRKPLIPFIYSPEPTTPFIYDMESLARVVDYIDSFLRFFIGKDYYSWRKFDFSGAKFGFNSQVYKKAQFSWDDVNEDVDLRDKVIREIKDVNMGRGPFVYLNITPRDFSVDSLGVGELESFDFKRRILNRLRQFFIPEKNGISLGEGFLKFLVDKAEYRKERIGQAFEKNLLESLHLNISLEELQRFYRHIIARRARFMEGLVEKLSTSNNIEELKMYVEDKLREGDSTEGEILQLYLSTLLPSLFSIKVFLQKNGKKIKESIEERLKVDTLLTTEYREWAERVIQEDIYTPKGFFKFLFWYLLNPASAEEVWQAIVKGEVPYKSMEASRYYWFPEFLARRGRSKVWLKIDGD